MTQFFPRYGKLEIPAEPVKPKVYYDALLNPPADGTPIVATLQGMRVEGKVRHVGVEYGIIYITNRIWIGGHFRGDADFAIHPKHGWQIELGDAPDAS